MMELNDESIMFTPAEGRNLYSQDQSMEKSKVHQSFQQEPDSSFISVFRTNNSSKDNSHSPKIR